MDFEARIDRLTGIVEALAASAVAHDNQIEAQNENIGTLGRHVQTLATNIERNDAVALRRSEAVDRQISALTQSVANLEKQWTAYLNTIHPRQ